MGGNVKILTVEHRLGFARAAAAVLRSSKVTDRTMSFKDFAIAIGMMGASDKWEVWHRTQITQILDLTAAAEHQGNTSDPLEFERLVRQDDQPGAGVRKFSRIVST
jgi:hypothetical protein